MTQILAEVPRLEPTIQVAHVTGARKMRVHMLTQVGERSRHEKAHTASLGEDKALVTFELISISISQPENHKEKPLDCPKIFVHIKRDSAALDISLSRTHC